MNAAVRFLNGVYSVNLASSDSRSCRLVWWCIQRGIFGLAADGRCAFGWRAMLVGCMCAGICVCVLFVCVCVSAGMYNVCDYVCMYVCLYVCAYKYTCMYVLVCISLCMFVYVCMCIYLCVCVCVCVIYCVCVHAPIYVYMCVHMRTYIHAVMYVYLCVLRCGCSFVYDYLKVNV